MRKTDDARRIPARSSAVQPQQNKPMKNKSMIISSVCVAALAVCTPLSVSAKGKKSEASLAPSASPGATAPRALPFHGMISVVDQNAKTFTIAGKEASRVFTVTDKTTITKDGSPATMSDIAEKEQVRGSYWKSEGGSLEAKVVKLGAKTEKEKTKKKAKKGKEEEASSSPTP
jgi:hypothetical protein